MDTASVAAESIQSGTMDLADIVPYENNPRFNENAVESVATSIKEFGFLVPIVVDEEGVVLAGHTRREAALKLGLEEVPVVMVSELSEAQKAAFRIADNRVAENANWDQGKLSEELEMLRGFGIDLSVTGFSMDEIDCLLEPINADCLDDLDHESVCGEVQNVPISESSRIIFSMGSFSFYLDKEDFLQWEKDMLDKYSDFNEFRVEMLKRLEIPEEMATFTAKK